MKFFGLTIVLAIAAAATALPSDGTQTLSENFTPTIAARNRPLKTCAADTEYCDKRPCCEDNHHKNLVCVEKKVMFRKKMVCKDDSGQ